MIVKLTMFGCKCDKCGNLWVDEYAGNIGFTDELGIHSLVSKDSSWLVVGGKHYCPDCWRFNASGNPEPDL